MTFVTKVLGKLTLLLAAQSPEFGCYIQRLIFNGDESHIWLFRCFDFIRTITILPYLWIVGMACCIICSQVPLFTGNGSHEGLSG